MGKVIPFRQVDSVDERSDPRTRADRAWDLVRVAAAGCIHALRYTVFLVLLWIRRPLRFLLSLVAVPALIALPLVGFGLAAGSPHKAAFMVAIAGAGFTAFVMSYLYDSLLLRLAPRPILLD